jgi:hypothetical protein
MLLSDVVTHSVVSKTEEWVVPSLLSPVFNHCFLKARLVNLFVVDFCGLE